MNLHYLIQKAPIVPTVMPTSVEALCAYANVLADEGYPALEILARPVDAALEAFRAIRERPERKRILWGIGTICRKADVKRFVPYKPDFIVSPAFSLKVLKAAAAADIPYLPAVCTFQNVQDVIDAFDKYEFEVSILKLCPVFNLGSEYVAALQGCFPGTLYCPTGEVTMENYTHWKSMKGIVAPMGSRFVPHEWIEACNTEAIRGRLREIRRMANECQ